MTRSARLALAVGALIASTALAACTASGETTPTPTPFPSATVAADAVAYCEQTGGTVQQRQPTYGTNDDESQWIALGDPVAMCRYQTLGDADDSRIYVDLVTLTSTQPTLAALAYLARTPIPSDATGNPASALCIALGGATSYGTGASGGGMVSADDPIDTVIATCVFADGSFIEEWGIAYYADGTVRGKDLAEVFRFDQDELPPVF